MKTQSDAEIRKQCAALAEYKRSVDLAWVAGMLAMSHELAGERLTAHGFVSYLQDAMRKAEREYQAAIRG